MAEQDTPVFQIQRVYLKDMSLEQPNSPAILLEQAQPNLDIQLGVQAEGVAEGVYEVSVMPPCKPRLATKRCFWLKPSKPGFSKSVAFPKSKWLPCWAWLARKSCTPTCVATWQTSSRALVSHLFTWRKSISRPCTSSSKPLKPTHNNLSVLGL